jgi:adenylyltransferase/sulfurtransferase
MLTSTQRERYLRHILLREIGGQGQQRLLASRVLIVGAGGLGAPILAYLAAAGVGAIGVADDDAVALSNLQRQVIYATADVGRAKTGAAAAFAARLNPDIRVIEHRLRVDDSNAGALVADYDLVVEGVDNFAARFALNRACLAARTPLVSAAVGRFDGQLATFRAFDDPGVLPCYRCLVPEAPPPEAAANCAEVGVLGAVTGVLGALAAVEAIKELLRLGGGLAGRLLVYDGLAGEFRTIRLPADPDCAECAVR